MGITNTFGTIFIKQGIVLPDTLKLETEPFVNGWMVVKNLDGYGLDRKIREMGWTFFCMASEITVTAVGFGEEKTLRRSFERILAMAKSKRYNSLEIAQTVSKRFLGVPYITVYARFRHIQKSMFLFREEDAQERSSTTRVGAVDSRSEGARDKAVVTEEVIRQLEAEAALSV
ncbi:MAG: hypothetical protein WB630_24515 [Candidatus Acidiferrales bacterium]